MYRAVGKGFRTIIIKGKEKGKEVKLDEKIKLVMSFVTETNKEQGKHHEVEILLIDDNKEMKVSERFVQDITNLVLETYGVEPEFGSYQYKRYNVKNGGKELQRRNKQYKGTELLKRNLTALGLEDYEKLEIMDMMRDTYDRETAKKEKNEAEKECTMIDVIKTKELLKGLVISIKDKNKYQLYAECPLKYLERLERNTTKDVFDEGIQYEEAMNKIKERWEDLKLVKYGKWKKGSLPYMYVIPKQKDPINKERLIASYYNHPLRALYKKVSKVLQWSIKRLGEMKQYTLQSVSDLKKKVKEVIPWIKGGYSERTELISVQTDIKQMFTYLNQDKIKKSVAWFLDKVLEDEKRKARNKKIFMLNKKDSKDVILSSGVDRTSYWCFTKEEIMRIVDMDLSTSYMTCKGKVWKQKQGCPIGGFLSAAYANIKCIYDETRFIARLKGNARKITAIRQMDDLIMWISYDRDDKNSKRWAIEMKNDIINGGLYKDGLILEEQKAEDEQEKKRKFCGVWIMQEAEPLRLKIKPRNINEESIIKDRRQEYPRFLNAKAWTNINYKKGLIIGNLARIEQQTTDEKDLLEAVRMNVREMRICGYKDRMLMAGVSKMASRYARWRNVCQGLMEKEREEEKKEMKNGEGYTMKRSEEVRSEQRKGKEEREKKEEGKEQKKEEDKEREVNKGEEETKRIKEKDRERKEIKGEGEEENKREEKEERKQEGGKKRKGRKGRKRKRKGEVEEKKEEEEGEARRKEEEEGKKEEEEGKEKEKKKQKEKRKKEKKGGRRGKKKGKK